MVKSIKNLPEEAKKLLLYITIAGSVFTTIVSTIKWTVPVVTHMIYGHERVDSLEQVLRETNRSLFLTTNMVEALMEHTDSCEYELKYKGSIILGVIKKTPWDDKFLFIPDNTVGLRGYSAQYSHSKLRNWTVDIEGKSYLLSNKGKIK